MVAGIFHRENEAMRPELSDLLHAAADVLDHAGPVEPLQIALSGRDIQLTFAEPVTMADQRTSVDRSRSMPCPASICACRYNGRCQANFDTATWASSAVVGRPPSTARAGAGACTTALAQARQP